MSGINKGWNIGDDVTYSGTVAGALEGALLGCAGDRRVAASARAATWDFAAAAAAAAHAGRARARSGRCRRGRSSTSTCRTAQPKGFRVTVQAQRNHVTKVAERHDPRGRPYYWIEEGQDDWEPHDRSDYQAVRDGYVSVTPLQPDLTAHDALALGRRT